MYRPTQGRPNRAESRRRAFAIRSFCAIGRVGTGHDDQLQLRRDQRRLPRDLLVTSREPP